MIPSTFSSSRQYAIIIATPNSYQLIPVQLPQHLTNCAASAVNHFLRSEPNPPGFLVAALPVEQFQQCLEQFPLVADSTTLLSDALSQSIGWLEANTDDDPAIVPALIKGYVALAKHHGTDPLTIRRQRTSPHDQMPRIVEGIGDQFESEWEWGDRIAKQFLAQHPLTSVSIRVINANGCMISIKAEQEEIASCYLPEIEPFQAQYCLEVVKLCLEFHGFSMIDSISTPTPAIP